MTLLKRHFQNWFLKKTLSKLLLQKRHFQNCSIWFFLQKIHFQNFSLKQSIFKIALSKKTFSKLFPLKSILKIAPSKKALSKIHPSKKAFSKEVFKIPLSKNAFSKLLSTVSKLFPQKRHYWNCSLKKTLQYLLLICSSSESLEQVSMPSAICLITFFLFNVSRFFHKALVDNSFHLFWEQNQ